MNVTINGFELKGVLKNDLIFPQPNAKDPIARDSKGHMLMFDLYYTKRFGWCVKTLGISRGKAGREDRTYGWSLKDNGLVTMGNGPHVLAKATVYVRESRREKLAFLLEAFETGMVAACEYRDRLSTNRARGRARRASWPSWM